MQLLINIDEEDYNNLVEQAKKYPPDMFTKIQNNIINGTPLPIRSAEDIAEEIDERGAISVPENCVTGEDYEAWLYEEKPCEDCVNRQAVLEIVEENNNIMYDAAYRIGKGVKALPSVTPKPKTGKWIETTVVIDEFTNEEDTFYVCERCNERICMPHKYCPNCGLKMEGAQDANTD